MIPMYPHLTGQPRPQTPGRQALCEPRRAALAGRFQAGTGHVGPQALERKQQNKLESPIYGSITT